ncbi:MAG: fatty acid desaturase family protein [Marinobacter sp.]|nr:fatty acid desaturase family protein [Marinobacter sp.]
MAEINNAAVYAHSETTRQRVMASLSREEIKAFTRRSDWMGVWTLVSLWAGIAACFLMMMWGIETGGVWAALALFLGVTLLGGRQLALAIATHEASHSTLFQSRWANDVLCDWLCARPLGLDLAKYRQHHFIHHTRTGTDDDSDISLVKGLPTTRRSMARKFLRDLSGLSGLKFLLGRIMMDAGMMKWTVANDVVRLPWSGWGFHLRTWVSTATPALLANAVLLGLLTLAGYPLLYLAWVVAYVVPFPLFIRIRSMAEHAGMARTDDMFRNTRTTRAGWLARVTVAPLRVNFHQEHHALASVPWYRLPRLHRTLRERGLVAPAPGYWSVLQQLSSE